MTLFTPTTDRLSVSVSRPNDDQPNNDQPRGKRVRGVLAGLTIVVLVGTGALTWGWWYGSLGGLPIRPHCTATALDSTTELDPEQAGNASIVAAVALRRGLPARAATIGIATALQESKLVNLSGGDRDSIGLFQQRPSQGWGSAEQVHDPVYATNAFYDVLVKIEGYQSLSITKAAQQVQRSAFPRAYASHEPEARIWASALAGYSPTGVNCVLTESAAANQRQARGTDGFTTRARAVNAAAREELGRVGVPIGENGTAVRFGATTRETSRMAWAVAQWAVAHANDLDIVAVEVGGKQWRRSRAAQGWTSLRTAPAGEVIVRVA